MSLAYYFLKISRPRPQRSRRSSIPILYPVCSALRLRSSPQTLLQLLISVFAIVILRPSIALSQLGPRIQAVACEKKIIFWSDSQGVAHERERVDCESACHGTRDPERSGISLLLTNEKLCFPCYLASYYGLRLTSLGFYRYREWLQSVFRNLRLGPRSLRRVSQHAFNDTNSHPFQRATKNQ